MIYGKYQDPVHLNRIRLKIWTLKSEIESTLAHAGEITPELFEEMKKFYERSSSIQISPEITPAPTPESDTEGKVSVLRPGNEQFIKERNPITRIKPPEENIAHGSAYLNEFNIDEMLFFSTQYFQPGQHLVVEFIIPNSFSIQAEVFYIKNVAMKSRIIAENKMSYRVGIKFLFNHPGDRTLLRSFLASISPHKPKDQSA